MELKEFALDFLNNALMNIESNGLTQEDAITSDLLEYLIQSGEVIQPELCHYKIRNIKINAYDYDDDNNTLDLYVTLFKNENYLAKVNDNDVEDAYKKALHFFQSVRTDKMKDKVDESFETVFELTQIIQQTVHSLSNLRVFVITNGVASSDIVPASREENGLYISFQLWDIERVYRHYLMFAGKQDIEIDFLTDYNFRLKCLKMEDVSEKVDVYLAIIPATFLASIYKKHRQALLEKNVRMFLQFKTAVNRNIRHSIRETPDMFFAYNNGISTTAESVDVLEEDNNLYITRIQNWQIVNGGQTTASIFATSEEKDTDLNLKKVFIQMKISVIKTADNPAEIVSNISKFANSQTAIRDSDFSSNHPYHIALENHSRSEWLPSQNGGKSTSKWYYERTRGQYLDELLKGGAAEQKKAKLEYPKNQKFTKTDLVKFEMSWMQRPHDVSKGAEKNFKLFDTEVENLKSEISKTYYHRLIAKAILFKEIDKIVMKKALGGYKANMVSYIIAWLSYKSNKKLNLETIWEQQKCTQNMYRVIDKMIDIVWHHINNPKKAGMNIGEWCKKQDCWIDLKDKAIDIEELKSEIKEDSDYQDGDNLGQELNPAEIKLVNELKNIPTDVWSEVSQWAKKYNKLTPFDRKLVYNIGVLMSKKLPISVKQTKSALKILKNAKDEGFEQAIGK